MYPRVSSYYWRQLVVDYPKDHWKQVFRTDPFILKVLEVLRAHGKKADIIESRPVLIVEGPKIILKNDPAVNLGCGDGEQVMREISPFRSEEHTSELQSQSNLVC